MASHFRKMTGKFIHFFQPERNESKKGLKSSCVPSVASGRAERCLRGRKSDFPNHSMNSLRSDSISYFVAQIVFVNPRLNIASENPTYSKDLFVRNVFFFGADATSQADLIPC